MEMFKEIKIKVEGEEIVFDRNKELVIHDLSEDQKKVASQMSFWGQLQASAESEKIRAETYYRAWRARQGEEILGEDPKLAEWKVKQKIESQADFQKLKNSIAQSTNNLIICRTVFDSFRIKANLLQSRGAMMRSELEATGMNTKETPPEEREKKKSKKAEGEGKGKKSHMKNVFSKK